MLIQFIHNYPLHLEDLFSIHNHLQMWYTVVARGLAWAIY
jgi:hypothetical protein